jgi:hypothetical protein
MALALFDCRPGDLAILATRRRCETLLQKARALEKPIASPELLTVEGSRLTSGCWIRWSDFA